VAFIVNQYYGLFVPADGAEWIVAFDLLQQFTDNFLAPFEQMKLLERDVEGMTTPWMREGERANTFANLCEISTAP